MRLSPIPLLMVLACAQPVRASTELVDAPELAMRGKYKVGVRTVKLVNPGQVDIAHFDQATGKAPLYDRPLVIEIWYPASIPAGQVEETMYESGLPGSPGKTFRFAGQALRDASPVHAESFPLVIVSHGYPGNRTFLSYLTENLASKGYVVAAIDHTDSVLGNLGAFQSTLLNRAADQIFTINALSERSRTTGDFLSGLMDESKVAIVGYSMGGYGALATAGAGYSKKGWPEQFVPGGYLDAWLAGAPDFQAHLPKNLKALVAIAPWGAQPPYSSWDTESFGNIRVPSLFIAGDQDDVSDYQHGIRPAFEGALHSERCLLVYENARHNVGGNPAPAGVDLNFEGHEFFDEPAWRKDRMASINQHFVTAFLDLYVKGDTTRRAYLHLTPEKSNDGLWPLPPLQSTGARFSDGGDAEHPFWKGFQRRSAVGLEMHCLQSVRE